MHIIIDLPEKTYQRIMAGYYDYGDMNLIIQNGITIPKDATNGDVINALFPNIEDCFMNVLDLKLWWNALYKAESEDKE